MADVVRNGNGLMGEVRMVRCGRQGWSGCIGSVRTGRTFFRFSGEEESTLRIPPSGPPIVVRFLSPDGKPLARKNVFVGIDGVVDVRRSLNQALASGGDPSSSADGSLRVAGLPAEGVLTICPYGRLDLAITRTLPIREEIVFTLPLGM